MKHSDLVEQFPLELRPPILAFMERLEEEAAETVTRCDFFRLEAAVERQSEHIAQLAAAQSRTDERLDKLVTITTGLAEAQVRTEENLAVLTRRVDGLTERMDQLAERMDQLTERMDQLAERMDQLTERMDQLAERMDQLTEEVGILKYGFQQFRKNFGAMTHNWGHSLEDKAIAALPRLLLRDHGVTVTGPLVRDYLETGKGRRIEINIWGSGLKEGKPVEIIGEAKSRLGRGHVVRFLAQVELIRLRLDKDVLPVLIAFLATPEARDYARERGIIYYPSYEF
jgi:hypothetical protein